MKKTDRLAELVKLEVGELVCALLVSNFKK